VGGCSALLICEFAREKRATDAVEEVENADHLPSIQTTCSRATAQPQAAQLGRSCNNLFFDITIYFSKKSKGCIYANNQSQ
jgi:hypothetical protein